MLYLASQSPRRQTLLQQIAVPFEQIIVDVDETLQTDESSEDYVCRLALAKAQAGFQQVIVKHPVLGADTIVLQGDKIFGKPRDESDACQMLTTLSGNQHEVLTAVALVNSDKQYVRLNKSQVYFRPLSFTEIKNYLTTEEGLDKAGAYAIQGIGSIFIEKIIGSYSGIMGLPLFETAQLLKEMDMPVIAP